MSGRWPATRYVDGAGECTASTAHPSDTCSRPYAHDSYACGDPDVGDGAVDLQGVTAGVTVAATTAGATTSTWNTFIGFPASFDSNGCWRDVHVHFEMTSWDHAGYDNGYYLKPGYLTNCPSTIDESNVVGTLGANDASGPRRMCP